MLHPIADELWSLQHQLRLPGGPLLPVRMTIVRLPGRALALHSPVPIDDAVATEIAGLGDVAHLIAPSRIHHMWLDAAAARYPRAAVWLAPGLAELHPDLRAAGTLGDAAPGPLRDHLAAVHLHGAPKIAETVFFHGASHTLICTDLVFHITQPANLRTRMMLGMMGTGGGGLAASRAWRLLTRDRAARDASIARVLEWDIRRIAMGHGDIFEGDGAAALRATRVAPRA